MHVQLRAFAAAKLSSSGAQPHPIRGLRSGTAQRSCLFNQLLHFHTRVRINSPSEQALRHRFACRRNRAKPSATATGVSRAPAQQRGYGGDDAAHWNFSPEWWGTQDGGWGRDAGTTVFKQRSEHGNGEASLSVAPMSGRTSARAPACSSQMSVMQQIAAGQAECLCPDEYPAHTSDWT